MTIYSCCLLLYKKKMYVKKTIINTDSLYCYLLRRVLLLQLYSDVYKHTSRLVNVVSKYLNTHGHIHNNYLQVVIGIRKIAVGRRFNCSLLIMIKTKILNTF